VFIVAGIVAVLVGGLFGASPASAHNTFIDSSPRDGEILTSTPATWSVTFEKSVPLESASGSIINGDGSRIALASPQHGATDRVIVFTMPSGLNGAISARWRLVGTDGHVISGRVSFTVQDAMGAAPAPTTPNADAATDDTAGAPDAVRVALRFANFAAIVLLGGLLFAEFDIASGALMTRRGRKLALWAAGILAAAPAAQFLIFANDISTGGEGFSSAAADALSMTAGGMLLLRVVAGLALALAYHDVPAHGSCGAITDDSDLHHLGCISGVARVWRSLTISGCAVAGSSRGRRTHCGNRNLVGRSCRTHSDCRSIR